MTDISREAVELAARWLHVQHGMFDEGDLILALRAAIDAAETERDYTQGTNDVLIGENQRLQARLDAAEARERQAVERAQKMHRRTQQLEGPFQSEIAGLKAIIGYYCKNRNETMIAKDVAWSALGRIEWQTKTSLDHPVCAVVHEIAAAAIRTGAKP